MTGGVDARRTMLRHALATIAYRTTKALKGAPATYSTYDPGEGARSPHALIGHMADDLGFAHASLRGERYRGEPASTWTADVERFYVRLRELDDALSAGAPLADDLPERLLQGPLADVLSHAGQMMMLRRLAGSPVTGENFRMADISVGRVGPDQAAPCQPFDRRPRDS